jgi:hypothetical protein
MEYQYTPYSYSKIKIFEDCPRKFKYIYIDKIKVPRVPKDYFDKGTFIHLLLQYDGDLAKIKNTKEFQEIKSNGLLSTADLREFVATYVRFKESNVAKVLFKRDIILREFELFLNHDLEIVEKDDDVFLRGYIDAAFVDHATDTLILVDYKTGRIPEKQSFKQLLFYAIGMFSLVPIDKIILAYVYVEHDKIKTGVLKRENIEKYKKALYNTVQKIEDCKDFPKVENFSDFCDYRDTCIEDV